MVTPKVRGFNAEQWMALQDHVTASPPGAKYHSTFNAALNEARELSARDGRGRPIKGKESKTIWSGAAMYLILLEQIGASLRPLGSRMLKNEPEIEKALRQFGGRLTSKRERQVLYALRCAFVHKFGLMNHRDKRSPYRRVFALDNTPNKPLVIWPKRSWDNTWQDAGPKTSTVVNLFALCELVEQVVKNIRVHSTRSTLRSECDDVLELHKAYGFTVEDS